MSKTKILSGIEIYNKIKEGEPFWVSSTKEQKIVLTCAKFMSLPKKLTTRSDGRGGFNVIFI